MKGLRQQAHEDAQRIMKESYGAAWPCVITSPDGLTAPFLCRSTDISATVDPDTGLIVSGSRATVVLLISDLITAGFGAISGIASDTSKPWVVDVDDINGVSSKFKVTETFPDRSLGLMACVLEVYKT